MAVQGLVSGIVNPPKVLSVFEIWPGWTRAARLQQHRCAALVMSDNLVYA